MEMIKLKILNNEHFSFKKIILSTKVMRLETELSNVFDMTDVILSDELYVRSDVKNKTAI